MLLKQQENKQSPPATQHFVLEDDVPNIVFPKFQTICLDELGVIQVSRYLFQSKLN